VLQTLFQKQMFCFSISQMISNQRPSASFCLKGFLISTWELNSFQKSTLSSREMVCNRFIKQNPCEKILVATFQECSKTKVNFHKLSVKSFVLKRGFRKPSLITEALPFKNENDFNHLQKNIYSLFDSSKRGAMLCFKNKLCFQNHMI
jgi:hypothetical protein